MAGEVQIAIPSVPTTAYFVVRNNVGQFWNTAGTPAFENYNAANWTDYDVALTQSGSSIHYSGTFPSGISAGVYSLTAYVQAGGSPAITDSLVGSDSAFYWTGSVRGALSQLATPTNITAATGIVLAGVTHTGAVIPSVTLVDTTTTNTDMRGTDNAAVAATALSTATWTGTLATNLGTLASHDPGATLGTSTLTQTQVTGGAYALNSASFGFNAAMDFTTTQKAATLARVTLVDTTTTNTDMRGTDSAALAATALSTAVWTSPPTGFLAATFPTTVASTTNITTVATVTNLTNAPTSGDLTATMKTSVTTAATAATPTVTAGTVSDKTGYSLHGDYDAAKTAATQTSVNAIPASAADAFWDELRSGHTTTGTFGATSEWVAGTDVQTACEAALTGFDFSGKDIRDVTGKVLGGGAGTITGTGVRAVDSSGNAIAPASATTAILAIFTGITSLAQWLGLIAGKQTGNTTARTELRATGAGSGTFDETTDSTQAIRDRGDVAWLSGAGASAAEIAAELASQPIVIQSPTTTNGTLDLVQGMDYYTADGRNIEFTFIREYTPSSCKLTIAAGAVVTVTSTDISESSGSGSGRFHVRFELPRATGDDLEAGPGSFEVLSIVGGNEVPEIAEGVATIRRRLTA